MAALGALAAVAALGATLPDKADVSSAFDRVRPYVRRTPVFDVDVTLPSTTTPASINLKLECMQHTGSFKVRGAFETLLTTEVPASGVAAASGGNHGIAVSHAARRLGHPATIFVPEISSPAKQAKIRACGADLRVGGERYADALQACEAFQAASGAIGAHAYDGLGTVLGQGTVAAEWEDQCPGLDTVLVAVGGGGLISGFMAWFGGRVKVVGVESRGCSALHSALAAGEPVDIDVSGIAADSLGAKRAGTYAVGLARATGTGVCLVEDEAIVEAQQRLWRECSIMLEPGGAAAFAALTSGAYQPGPGERVGVLLCGANVDLAKVQWT